MEGDAYDGYTIDEMKDAVTFAVKHGWTPRSPGFFQCLCGERMRVDKATFVECICGKKWARGSQAGKRSGYFYAGEAACATG